MNSVSLRHQEQGSQERRHLYGYSGSTATKLAATVASGLAIGVTAAALQLAVDQLSRHRNAALDALVPRGGLPAFFGALMGLGGTAVLVTTLVVHLWAPRAAGGGVALVMALLNGK